MGTTSGKLILTPANDKLKSDSEIETVIVLPTKETASQLVNGDANAVCNVPPIDEVTDEPDTLETKVESQPDENQPANGPNGCVSPSLDVPETHPEVTNTKKKSKNPIMWIKRRLSKKISVTKTQSKEEDQPEASTEVNEQAVADVAVLDAANSLVEEVLAVAVAHEMSSEVQQQPEPTAELSTRPTDVSQAESVAISEVGEVDVIVAPNELSIPQKTGCGENGIVNGGQTEEQRIDIEQSATDTNNTNVYNGLVEVKDHDSSLSMEVISHDDVSPANKLANLEPKYEHEIHSRLENGDAQIVSVSNEVAVNLPLSVP